MNARHKLNLLQTHHELFPTPTGVTRCHCTTPRGGATKKKADPTTQHALIGFKHPHLPQPSALHNRTCPCPLTSDRTRNARAPTSPRSIGFCAIWESISSSSRGPGPAAMPAASYNCSKVKPPSLTCARTRAASHEAAGTCLATTTARYPQRSHLVSPSTAASRRGAAAIGTSLWPQRPCPRTPTASSVSAKFTPK